MEIDLTKPFACMVFLEPERFVLVASAFFLENGDLEEAITINGKLVSFTYGVFIVRVTHY